jgi:hypothetical protein
MRQLAVLSAMLLLSACATMRSARPAPTPQWLVGAWLMVHQGDRDLIGCSSFAPIAYNPDGTYALFDESGTWRLEGDRLTETATEELDTADPGTVHIGHPYVSRIRPVGRDEFIKTYATGARETFLRCPPPE